MLRGTIKNKNGKNVLSKDILKSISKMRIEQDKEIGKKIVEELYVPYLNNETFLAASRIVRYHHKNFVKFWKQVKVSSALKSKIKKNGIPFFVPLIDGKNVDLLVFPNLKINPFSNDINYTSWLFNPDPLLPLIKSMEEESQRKWETVQRSIKNIKVRQEQSVGRYLKRSVYADEAIESNKLRTMTTNIVQSFMPPEIVFCKTPKDWQKMYEEGSVGSCMTDSPGRPWTEIQGESPDFHPAVFYHYAPEIGGCFMLSGNKVVARCITTHRKDKNIYTRIYSASPNHNNKLREELENQGYISSRDSKFSINKEFKIPGFKHGSVYIMPLPYMDLVTLQLNTQFNEVTKEFEMIKIVGDKKQSSRSQGGYITSNSLVSHTCYNCGNKFSDGLFSDYDNNWFCGWGCANRVGYINATRSDGVNIVQPKTESYQDAFAPNAYFTNRQSCSDNGGRPAITDGFILPEIDEYTPLSANGYSVWVNNVNYNMDYNKLNTLAERRIDVTDSSKWVETVGVPVSFKIPKKEMILNIDPEIKQEDFVRISV